MPGVEFAGAGKSDAGKFWGVVGPMPSFAVSVGHRRLRTVGHSRRTDD